MEPLNEHSRLIPQPINNFRNNRHQCETIRKTTLNVVCFAFTIFAIGFAGFTTWSASICIFNSDECPSYKGKGAGPGLMSLLWIGGCITGAAAAIKSFKVLNNTECCCSGDCEDGTIKCT